ncbi:extracellular calcium-sensing receptor-like [Protopterus annectens]|uniref:extracellular calcium-sensing receptor-like n=1 Tax=Protopterus annectens TaxID=7888 RepID=UPI001CF9F786|nr:extracellular calcium-sensing receptor-like [Protopterus annectens]
MILHARKRAQEITNIKASPTAHHLLTEIEQFLVPLTHDTTGQTFQEVVQMWELDWSRMNVSNAQCEDWIKPSLLDTIPYQEILTIVYATMEINADYSLLPNVTLGFRILDSCYSKALAVECALRLMSEVQIVPNYSCGKQRKMSAIIGESFSSTTLPVARLLGLYGLSQVSHSAVLPILSDKNQFPSFLRTVMNGYSQPLGLVELIKLFDWTWIGIIYADKDFSVQASQQLKEAFIEAHACVAFNEVLPTEHSRKAVLSLVEKIVKSSATVVIIYAYGPQVALLLEEITAQNVTGKVWVASSSWITDSVVSKRELWKTLHGTLGFAMYSGDIPGFKEFLYSIHPLKYPHDIYMKPFWEAAFSCRWTDSETLKQVKKVESASEVPFCSGDEHVQILDQTIFPVDNLRFTYTMFNAVYSLAHALHNLQTCRPGEGPFRNNTCADRNYFQPWQLLHYVKKVHFVNKAGHEIYFDVNGDAPVLYDIINWQLRSEESMKSVKLGSYKVNDDGSQTLIINKSTIMWSAGYIQYFPQTPQSVCSSSCPPGYRKVPLQGMPICCYDCVQCSEGKISNQTDAADCIKCSEVFWSNEERMACISKQVDYLSYEDALGAVLTGVIIYLSIISASVLLIFIVYRDTPIVRANNQDLSYFLLVALILCFLCSLLFIGKPNNLNCKVRQSAFGITFSVCISSIMAKTITVAVAFGATRPGSFQKRWVGSKIPSLISLFCSTLQIFICSVWLGMSSPYPVKNLNVYKNKIILECNEGSITMFYCMLGYLGLLAIVCFIIAFIVRSLPDRYNEAKFITFSMLIFISVWLSFIPAYMSTKGKYVAAVEIFAILSSGTGLLSCIFFPKCYIMLLRPELNTKVSAKQKGH